MGITTLYYIIKVTVKRWEYLTENELASPLDLFSSIANGGVHEQVGRLQDMTRV